MRVAGPDVRRGRPGGRTEGVDLHLDQEQEQLAPRARRPAQAPTSPQRRLTEVRVNGRAEPARCHTVWHTPGSAHNLLAGG
jgi:hypothetical protein